MALTKVTNSMISGAFINVMDYGATGDGSTNDQAAIQTAINALPLDGGTVYFPPGVYVLTTTDATYDRAYLVIDQTNVHVTGSGATLKTTAGTRRQNMIYVINAANVLIEGLTFDNNSQALPARNQPVAIEASSFVTVQNCVCQNKCGPLFVYKNSDNVLIQGNRFVDGLLGGIATGGDDVDSQADGTVSYVVIKDNYIDGSAAEGVDINHDTQHFIIDSNYLANQNTGTGGAGETIDIGGDTVCKFGVISNNFIYVNEANTNGITLKQNTTDLKIENNTIIDESVGSTDSRGIEIETDGSISVQIVNNYINGFSRGIATGNDPVNNSILISGNRIQDCTIIGIAADGIDISVISNNVDMFGVVGGQRGIGVTGSEKTIISNNFVEGNSTLDYAMYINGVSNGVVSGNTISNSERPFYMDSVNGVSVTSNCISDGQGRGVEIANSENVIFSNNTVFDNGKSGTPNSFGVLFATVVNASASSNAVYDTRTGGAVTEYGAISADANCDYIVFTGNVVSNTLNNSVAVNGAVPNSVVANNLT